MLRWILVALIAVVLGFMAYVRFSPVDVTAWHKASGRDDVGDVEERGGFEAIREITSPTAEILDAVDRIAMASPRTSRIAGSVEDGIITYMTRTAFFGFPDFTTVSVLEDAADTGPILKMHGRLRFGLEDMDVNKTRITRWLDQLGPLIVAP